jgi:hypothetical protein
MTTEIARGSPNAPLDRSGGSPLVRGLMWLLLILLIAGLLAAFAAGIFALRWWVQDRAAAAKVDREVARLKSAGEPVTTEDLYHLHAVPEGVNDTTAAWLAAQQACDASRLNQDGKGLPFIGNGNVDLLRPDATGSQLAAAEKLLADYAPAIDAIQSAAAEPGQCRYPVKFEQGFNFILKEVNEVRTIMRLLALHVRVKAIRGERGEALKSLAAMYAASGTLSHQVTIVEQQIRLATLGLAMQETEFVLNEIELTDDQLAELSRQLEACNLQPDFTRSLLGERELGNQSFEKMKIPFNTADQAMYLETMAQVISYCSQPLPEGRKELTKLVSKFKAEKATARDWGQWKYHLTSSVLPFVTASFEALAKTFAYRDALVTAIAAERFRLKTGRFPSRLADLTPDYLPTITLDPFDGLPLRLRATEKEIVIYSIGPDGHDDGGTNPPGNPREPDIVVRLYAEKTGSP